MRYKSLDAVRGIAALIVVLTHLYSSIVLKVTEAQYQGAATFLNPWAWLHFTPLRVLISGTAMVMLFFVLSGFALAAMLDAKNLTYPEYLVRRLCRIYLPFVASIIFSLVLYRMFSGWGKPVASDWFYDSWIEGGGVFTAKSLLMMGVKEYESLNRVTWSLVHEMRISIIFPFIYIACVRRPWSALLGALLAYIGSGLVVLIFHDVWIIKTIAETAGYVLFFYVGCLIYLNRNSLKIWMERVKARWWLAFALIVVCGFSVPPGVLIISNLVFGVASAMVVIICITSEKFERFLSIGVLQWAGKVSYSLYLVHLPIILASFYALSSTFPPLLVALIAVVVSCMMANLSFRYIERPTIRLGSFIGRYFSGSRGVASP